MQQVESTSVYKLCFINKTAKAIILYLYYDRSINKSGNFHWGRYILKDILQITRIRFLALNDIRSIVIIKKRIIPMKALSSSRLPSSGRLKQSYLMQCDSLFSRKTLHRRWEKELPLDEGAKEQSDGLLNVLSAQPTPLVLHQQTQDVQNNICNSCVCT